MPEKKLWFKAKSYGWGWYPSSWEGWTILGIWIYLVGFILILIDKNSHSVSDTLIRVFIPFMLMLILLILVCWGTGEKPSWRWETKKV